MERAGLSHGTGARHTGQALIEFAVILPVLLLLLLGMIDLGRAFVFGVAVQDGARQAARLGTKAQLDTSVTNAVIRQRLIDAARPAMLGCSSASATCTDSYGVTWTFTLSPDVDTLRAANTNMSGSPLTVTARGSVSLLTGFATGWMNLGLNAITVQGSAAMEIL
jgi:Flp pilus assembly protein TadG